MQTKKTSRSLIAAIISAVALIVVGILAWVAVPQKQPENTQTSNKPQTDWGQIEQMLKVPEATVSLPKGMKGFYLAAGDLVQKEGVTPDEVAKRIDAILSKAVEYQFNAVMLETAYQKQMLYSSASYQSYAFDIFKMFCEKAAIQNIAVYPVYNLLQIENQTENADYCTGAAELAQKYAPAGILISGYYTMTGSDSYAAYMANGGGSGYDEWLRSRNMEKVSRLIKTVREVSTGIPVGLLTDSVWRSKTMSPDGVETKLMFSSFDTGHADVREMLQKKQVDFICLNLSTAISDSSLGFNAALDWWNALAQETGTPLVVLHAGEKACTKEPGWNGTDQLARQVANAAKADAYHGSFFSGYDHLISDPQGSTTALLKFLSNEYKEENLFTDLTISQPAKILMTTYEDTVIFHGKYDPQFEVTINGTKIIPTKAGEFYEKYSLKVGINQFIVKHKGQAKTYSVNRKVQVFQSVSPTGRLEVDGGVTVQVEAMAYRGAKVTAALNGKTITLKETTGNEENRESVYTRFIGSFTVPVAGDKNKAIGSIVFKASYSSSSETKTGAAVTVLKKMTVPNWSPNAGGDGSTVLEPLDPKRQVIVTSPYVEVYNPADTITYPSPLYYSLPQGTIDYVVSQRTLTYEGVTKNFYYLHSGKRVVASEVKLFTGTYHGNNAISDLSLADEGNQTILKVKQKWSAPFNISFGELGYYTGGADSDFWVKDFTSDTVTITFDYATQAEQVGKELLKNTTMFTDVRLEKVIEYNVSRYRLHLKLSKPGRYYGCYSEYDSEGYLVLRFNHLPGSLQGVRVFLDPGHGGVDPGAIGKYVENGKSVILYESNANLSMVKKLIDKLQAEGAVVGCLTEDERGRYRKSSLADRYKAAQRFKADIFLSVHCNSAGAGSSAGGTSAYYTTPYSMPLAREISKGIAAETGIKDRGANCNYFAVNRGRTFPSVLIETAFISNPDEVKLLASQAGQDKITAGIVKGLQNYLKLNA